MIVEGANNVNSECGFNTNYSSSGSVIFYSIGKNELDIKSRFVVAKLRQQIFV